jgi:hypothetical protein
MQPDQTDNLYFVGGRQVSLKFTIHTDDNFAIHVRCFQILLVLLMALTTTQRVLLSR